MARRKNRKPESPDDLKFTFSKSQIKVTFNSGYFSKEEETDIRNIVSTMSKTICVDKSYVDFKENKHTDVFIQEEGWKFLCDLMISTKFMSRLSIDEENTLFEIFELIVICYLYQCIEYFDYDVSNIHLELARNSRIMTEVEYDYSQSWKTYPGNGRHGKYTINN